MDNKQYGSGGSNETQRRRRFVNSSANFKVNNIFVFDIF